MSDPVREGMHAIAWLLQSQGGKVEWREDEDGWCMIIHPGDNQSQDDDRESP